MEELIDAGGMKALMAAIVLQAFDDYVDCLNATKPGQTKKYGNLSETWELERFFRSDWCYELCGIDGEAIIMRAKEVAGVA